jgi:hypothetical protein
MQNQRRPQAALVFLRLLAIQTISATDEDDCAIITS